jgi:hypothetical protein
MMHMMHVHEHDACKYTTPSLQVGIHIPKLKNDADENEKHHMQTKHRRIYLSFDVRSTR